MRGDLHHLAADQLRTETYSLPGIGNATTAFAQPRYIIDLAIDGQRKTSLRRLQHHGSETMS